MAKLRKRQALEMLVEGGADSTWEIGKWACLAKRAYPSIDAAMRALRHLPQSRGPLRPYVCQYATDGHVHMTSER